MLNISYGWQFYFACGYSILVNMATKKATSTKKPTARKKVSTVRSTKRPKATQLRSFHVAKPELPFMTFTVTRQTVYWLVLGAIVIVFGFWINKLQSDIQSIYDSIDQNTLMSEYSLPKRR